MYEEETKTISIEWEYKMHSSLYPMNVKYSLDEINNLILDCNNVLSSAGMNGISYSSKAGEIERLCGNIGIMNAYIDSIRYQMSDYIDAPLYQGFRNKAAETISTIHLEDVRTTNTLGVKAIEYTEGYATDEEELKKDLGFEDFLGTADYSGAEPGDQLKAFTAMFQSDYENLKAAGNFESGSIESVDDYLNEIMSMGEFDHKKDQPLLSFLSGLADITIILPLIEGCAGYDFITGEELTGFESGMKIVFAVVDIATLGMAIGATGVLEAGVSLTAKEGALLLGKTVVIETASNIAGYTTGFMANEADLPAPLVIMLSILAGSSISAAGTKLAFKNGAEEVILDSVESTAKASFAKNLDDVLAKQGISLDEFNQLRLKDVATLTDAEKTTLKTIRESVPMPNKETLMQKFIPASDIEKYMDGTYTQVGGFVVGAEDVVQLSTYDDIYNSCRFDYPNSVYTPLADDSIGVIKFTTDEASKISIPYSPEMGGTVTQLSPFTGNGFTKAMNGQIIPEYNCDGYLKLSDGAQLIEISKDGTETLRAVYDVDFGKFVAVE